MVIVPSSVFFKVAFWRPRIIKWSPEIEFAGARDISRLNTWTTRVKEAD